MTIVFVSNYLNNHQIPLCTELKNRATQFWFVATEANTVWGYQTPMDADYVLEYNPATKDRVYDLIKSADVVIYGSTPTELINIRMELNKLSFLYSERFYKKGLWRSINPKTRKKLYDRIVRYKNNEMYVLCAGAFLPLDLKLLGFPTNKCYKWGYFTEVKKVNIGEYIDKKRKQKYPQILWVGRMDEPKHPEVFVDLVDKLKKDGYVFRALMVGDGPINNRINSMIHQRGLTECIELVGSKSHDEVANLMIDSKIFVFTSDKWEGWGAVLGEAMASGCVPYCSHSIGAVPFLVDDGNNGFVYRYGHHFEKIEKLEKLLDDNEYCETICKQAYRTMSEMWNAELAAERLLKLCNSFLSKKGICFESGPCSKANLLKENWISKR